MSTKRSCAIIWRFRVRGEKSEAERTGSGSESCLEAMVRIGRRLGQAFTFSRTEFCARESGFNFRLEQETQEFGWTTNWGMTTRLVGTVIMAHGDDDGLVLPHQIRPRPRHLQLRQKKKRGPAFWKQPEKLQDDTPCFAYIYSFTVTSVLGFFGQLLGHPRPGAAGDRPGAPRRRR